MYTFRLITAGVWCTMQKYNMNYAKENYNIEKYNQQLNEVVEDVLLTREE